jgi:hypothetical protein
MAHRDVSLRRNDKSAIGAMLLKNDFEGDLRVILIQGERPTSKIDSKVRLL